jgi:hypothetical protein
MAEKEGKNMNRKVNHTKEKQHRNKSERIRKNQGKIA